MNFPGLLRAFWNDLPPQAPARWASLFLSFCVFTLLISLAATQAFLALAAAFYAVHLLQSRRDEQDHWAIKFPPVLLPLALFCLLTVISIFFSTDRVIGWFAVRKLVLFLIILLTVNLVVSRRHLGKLYAGLFFESALAAVVGSVQFVRQYQTVRALHPGRIYFYLTASRIRGFMGHWMNFGGQQMLVFLALAALLLLAARGRRPAVSPSGPAGRQALGGSALWWGILVLIGISIVLNSTRGVWLGCFVSTIYLVARWRARWLWALPVLVAVTYVASPSLLHKRLGSVEHPSADPSLSIRFEMWRNGLRMIRAHPWLGVGPDNIPEVYNSYLPPGVTAEIGYHDHLHNDYLQFAAERGVPCLAAWLWFMLALLSKMFGARKRLEGSSGPRGPSGKQDSDAQQPEDGVAGHGLQYRVRAHPVWVVDAAIACWLALMTEGFFEFNFGSSPVLMVFLFMISTPFAEALDPRRLASPNP